MTFDIEKETKRLNAHIKSLDHDFIGINTKEKLQEAFNTFKKCYPNAYLFEGVYFDNDNMLKFMYNINRNNAVAIIRAFNGNDLEISLLKGREEYYKLYSTYDLTCRYVYNRKDGEIDMIRMIVMMFIVPQ